MTNVNSEIVKDNKIKRVFIKDEAYDRLNTLIVTGVLAPMTKIRVSDLSEQLGISRTPLREAILRLENDGLIISKANRWTMVAPININDALKIYPIISALECLALKEAFDKLTDSDIKELEKINENINSINAKNNLLEKIQADNAFHKKIIDSSGNDEIFPIIKNLKRKVQRMEIFYYDEIQGYSKTYDSHKNIIKYIKNGDLDNSLKALNKNWEDTLEIFHRISQNQE
ncbi:MAG: GntR family transcriptional regulator [Peptoniphilaceae bacterium]|nr:GntR family transcriptional regulator [Peptoniphilaceae bacterium]MDY6018722.1 GntR family transcriptional regulator [Anaerococcus sp.]